MQWVYLAVACVFEIVFALSSNAAQGFTRFWPSVLTITAAAGGIYSLSLALRTLEVGVAYTIWTGIGSVGTVLLGTIIFKEKLNALKIASFLAIILGVIGLRAAVMV